MFRRLNPSDLDTARKVVARAESRALDQAEEYRRQAEDILKEASSRSEDPEARTKEEYSAELAALRTELEAARCRAAEAETQLGLLRRPAPAPAPGQERDGETGPRAQVGGPDEADTVAADAHNRAGDDLYPELSAEIVRLREAVDRTRESLERVLAGPDLRIGRPGGRASVPTPPRGTARRGTSATPPAAAATGAGPAPAPQGAGGGRG